MRDALISSVWMLGWSLIALAAFGARVRKLHALRILLLLPLALWWLLSAPITANLLIGHLENMAARDAVACKAPGPGAVFVVLAGGVRVPASSPSQPDVTALDGGSLRRLIAAERIAASVPKGRLILSGGSGGQWKEADLMRELASRLGFDASRIEVDRVSRTTYQSALDLKARLAGRPAGSTFLVTSAYHMPRAYLAFRRSGIDVCALPVDFQAAHVFHASSWVPTPYAFTMMSEALHEYLGLADYAWKLRGGAAG